MALINGENTSLDRLSFEEIGDLIVDVTGSADGRDLTIQLTQWEEATFIDEYGVDFGEDFCDLICRAIDRSGELRPINVPFTYEQGRFSTAAGKRKPSTEEVGSMHCQHCGAQQPGTAAQSAFVCQACRTMTLLPRAADRQVSCPSCNAGIAYDALEATEYCPHCGKPLDVQTITTAAHQRFTTHVAGSEAKAKKLAAKQSEGGPSAPAVSAPPLTTPPAASRAPSPSFASSDGARDATTGEHPAIASPEGRKPLTSADDVEIAVAEVSRLTVVGPSIEELAEEATKILVSRNAVTEAELSANQAVREEVTLPAPSENRWSQTMAPGCGRPTAHAPVEAVEVAGSARARSARARWCSNNTRTQRRTTALASFSRKHSPTESGAGKVTTSSRFGDRVWCERADGSVATVPRAWTDPATPEPFVALAEGKAHFRPEDLSALAELVAQIRGGGQSPDGVDRV